MIEKSFFNKWLFYLNRIAKLLINYVVVIIICYEYFVSFLNVCYVLLVNNKGASWVNNWKVTKMQTFMIKASNSQNKSHIL